MAVLSKTVKIEFSIKKNIYIKYSTNTKIKSSYVFMYLAV